MCVYVYIHICMYIYIYIYICIYTHTYYAERGLRRAEAESEAPVGFAGSKSRGVRKSCLVNHVLGFVAICLMLREAQS